MNARWVMLGIAAILLLSFVLMARYQDRRMVEEKKKFAEKKRRR